MTGLTRDLVIGAVGAAFLGRTVTSAAPLAADAVLILVADELDAYAARLRLLAEQRTVERVAPQMLSDARQWEYAAGHIRSLLAKKDTAKRLPEGDQP